MSKKGSFLGAKKPEPEKPISVSKATGVAMHRENQEIQSLINIINCTISQRWIPNSTLCFSAAINRSINEESVFGELINHYEQVGWSIKFTNLIWNNGDRTSGHVTITIKEKE